jgi:hypothetical protein
METRRERLSGKWSIERPFGAASEDSKDSAMRVSAGIIRGDGGKVKKKYYQ